MTYMKIKAFTQQIKTKSEESEGDFFKLTFLEAATLSRAIALDAGKGTGPVTFNSPLQSEDKVMTFSIKLNLFDLKKYSFFWQYIVLHFFS